MPKFGPKYTCASATTTRFVFQNAPYDGCQPWDGSSKLLKTVGTDASTGVTGTMTTCTANCAANMYVADGQNKQMRCLSLTMCGKQVAVGSNAAVTRTIGEAKATDGTATGNNACAACAHGTWADGNGDCAVHSLCGTADCSPNARATIGKADATTNTVCAACGYKTWSTAFGNCESNTYCGKQVGGNSRDTTVTDVEQGYVAHSNTAAGTCWPCNNTGSHAADDASDCTPCTAVKGGIATSCTTADDSWATCSCVYPKHTFGGVGAADTCTLSCAAGTWDNADECTDCTIVGNASTVTCTSATDSTVVTCATGFDLGSGACTATPMPTPAAAPTADGDVVGSASTTTIASFVVMVAVAVASSMH